MRELERRLEALEAQQEPAGAMDVIVVGMVAPGEEPQEIHSLSHNDRVWRRQDGETEEQFKERVCREVPRARDCVPVLLSGYMG